MNHPNKKIKPKHTAKFRYDNSGHPIKIGASRRCKAVSTNPIKVHGLDFKTDRYATYSKVIWQEIKFVYTARESRKRKRI